MIKTLALETGISLHRGTIRRPQRWGGGSFTGHFERKMRFCFIKRACLLGNLREKCKRRLWKRTSLSIGSPSGEPGVGLVLPGTLRHRLEGSGIGMSLSMEAL